METMHFTDKNGTFFLLQPENYSYLYFPVAMWRACAHGLLWARPLRRRAGNLRKIRTKAN